ncbi:substrate-binding domain-containing protein [Fimbriimonas ginsengisoli]|nr:substrate-binding domain-containing protein [Fimbriimonas ginsengisoli]
MTKSRFLVFAVGIAVIGAGCRPAVDYTPGIALNPASVSFLTGSETEPLRPLVEQYARKAGVQVTFESKGAVDIMLGLKSGDNRYDAIWPSNSMWVTLGGNSQVKEGQSIMRTPVILWVKRSTAKELGWIGKTVKMQDILPANQSGKLNMLVTSATQSNSGASAYFGYLSAFSGAPAVLGEEHLNRPDVRKKIKSFYDNIKHSFGSSKWAKDYFIDHYDEFNSMINYESMGIEANRTLASSGREPLYAVYPVDGLTIADCPMYYVDHGDDKKHQFIRGLQQFLQSPEAQQEIMRQGWRVGAAGMGTASNDSAAFSPDWGVDMKRVLQPIRFPSPQVIEKGLSLYQTVLRRPIARAYCLDFSGSMEGEGQRQVKQAMRLILDPEEARKHFLDIGPDDITVVITFDSEVIHQWVVRGNDPKELRDLNAKVQAESIRGGTDIFLPVEEAIGYFKSIPNLERHMVSVELMTDGRSDSGSVEEVMAKMSQTGVKVPVYSIGFGDADDSQLQEIAKRTSAKYFDGKKDLVKTFREVSGYN